MSKIPIAILMLAALFLTSAAVMGTPVFADSTGTPGQLTKNVKISFQGSCRDQASTHRASRMQKITTQVTARPHKHQQTHTQFLNTT